MTNNDQEKPWFEAGPRPPEYKEKHQPVTGGLYQARRTSTGRIMLLKKGDIIMVVSDLHCLMDIRRVQMNGQIKTTHEWIGLLVLLKEKIWDFSSFQDDAWYEWFERINFDAEF